MSPMRLWTYLLPIPIILFYVLSLTGCACIEQARNIECSSTSGLSSETLMSRLSQNYTMTATDRVLLSSSLSAALTMQSKIFVCLLAGAGVLFFVGLILLVLLKRGLKAAKPVAASRLQFYKRSTINTLWLSTSLALSSALATTETLGALQYWSTLTSANLKLFGGVSLQVLQWLVFSFSALFAFGISTIFKSSEENVSSAGSDVEKATPGSGPGASSGGAPPIPALNF